ncbi:MFS transporter [Corynebacterium lizhenjunii]|uniref:MFS transporter n=1 Tax=Corynebacterium lizhenjunii TaxID=2709394 RepID=UPI0022A6D665|nr:MFS transporter [Corynebacterium lizhenjunii]
MALFRTNPSYRSWFVADMSGEIARQIVFAAMTLLAYSVTNDVKQTGFVAALMALARFVAMLGGSWVVDFYPKRRLMVINALCRIVLSVLTVGLLLADRMGFVALVAVAVGYGAIGGIFGNLTNAILPFIVDDRELNEALSLNETRDSIIQIAAAPLSVFLFTALRALPFVVDILGFAIVAIGARFIHGDLEAEASDDAAPGVANTLKQFWERSTAGLRWVARHPGIRAILALWTLDGLSSFLVINAVELNILHSDQPTWHVGAVFACFSAGMVGGGLISGRLRKVLSSHQILILAATVNTVVMACLSIMDHWMVVGALLAVWTLPTIASNAVLGSSQMIATPDNLQGRVGAAFGLIIGLTPILGAGLAGVLLDHVGWRITILLAAALGVASLAVVFASRALRDIVHDPVTPPSAPAS